MHSMFAVISHLFEVLSLWKISFYFLFVFNKSHLQITFIKTTEENTNFSLYVLLCRKNEQENKAVAVVEQMSPNME